MSTIEVVNACEGVVTFPIPTVSPIIPPPCIKTHQHPHNAVFLSTAQTPFFRVLGSRIEAVEWWVRKINLVNDAEMGKIICGKQVGSTNQYLIKSVLVQLGFLLVVFRVRRDLFSCFILVVG